MLINIKIPRNLKLFTLIVVPLEGIQHAAYYLFWNCISHLDFCFFSWIDFLWSGTLPSFRERTVLSGLCLNCPMCAFLLGFWWNEFFFGFKLWSFLLFFKPLLSLKFLTRQIWWSFTHHVLSATVHLGSGMKIPQMKPPVRGSCWALAIQVGKSTGFFQ